MAYRLSNDRIDQAHTDSIFAVTFAQDKIVSGSVDSTIKVWKQDSLELFLTLEGHRLGIVSLASDPTGKCTYFEQNFEQSDDYNSGGIKLNGFRHQSLGFGEG